MWHKDLNSFDKIDYDNDVCKDVCNDKHEKVNDDNISLKIMKRKGFKGKVLGKDEQGMMNLIEQIRRPIYEGLEHEFMQIS